MTNADILASLNLLLIVATYVTITCGIAALLLRFVSRSSFKGTSATIFAFGLLGGTIGYAVANSRQPIAGTVIPAFLTFVTVLLGYLFSKENLKSWRPVIPYCICVLVINTFLGFISGSIIRRPHEEFDKRYQEYLMVRKDQLEIRKQKHFKIIERQTNEQLEEELRSEYAAEAQAIAAANATPQQ